MYFKSVYLLSDNPICVFNSFFEKESAMFVVERVLK